MVAIKSYRTLREKAKERELAGKPSENFSKEEL
jgi:hypothetical protein